VTAAETQRVRRRRAPLVHYLTQNSSLLLGFFLLALVIVVYLVLFARQIGNLPGNFELTATVDNAAPLAFAALGQSLIMLTGGIDLSVGGLMDLTNGVAALTLTGSAGHILLWSVITVLIGAAGGLLNGVLVAFGRLQPILVTLGTLAIYQGLALKVLPQPGGHVAGGVTAVLANPDRPTGFVVIAVGLVLWWVLRRTSLGIGIYAIGNDRQAARAVGVPVRWITVSTYTLSGAFVGFAGLLLAAQTTGGDANAGNVFTLTSIAAAVIGGVSLFGGRGSAAGGVVGAFVLTVLVDVLFFGHINPLEEPLYEGLFLVVAAALTAFAALLLRRGLR
jgi:ribose transport system permease protein